VWCFLILILPGLLAGTLMHKAEAEFALDRSALRGTGSERRILRLGPDQQKMVRHIGSLLIASVLSHLWWFAVALLMLKGPHVTVWMEVALLPQLILGTFGLDIARRAHVLAADG
jgi:hypothetical protein